MNGNKIFLDTNAIVSVLKGNSLLHSKIKDADWVGASIISQIEFLSFKDLSGDDRDLFYNFSRRIDIIGINKTDEELISKIISLRNSYKIKLPDAVIAATSSLHGAVLLTADKELLKIKQVISSGF